MQKTTISKITKSYNPKRIPFDYVNREKEQQKNLITVPAFHLDQKKSKITERQSIPNPAMQVATRSDFEKLKAESSARYPDPMKPTAGQIHENYLYVTRNEHTFRESRTKMHKSVDKFDP